MVGVGSDRDEIKKEENGNIYMSITVKKRWGQDYGTHKNPTERSEPETKNYRLLERRFGTGLK